jgi:hypothetical protein
MNTLPTQPRNERLYALAHQRVRFRYRAITYAIVLAFLTAIWYLTSGPRTPFWPGYAAIGFGIGLAIRFTKAYLLTGAGSVDREYEKLTDKR